MNVLIQLQHLVDPRTKCLGRDPVLAEAVRSKANAELNSLSKLEIVELVTSAPNFYALQQTLLAVDQEYQKKATDQEFAEIYNRASPNQSFNMGGDNSNSENNSFIVPGDINESFKEKTDERKCQCSIF